MSRTFRRHWPRGATAVASVMALTWLATGAPALGAASGPHAGQATKARPAAAQPVTARATTSAPAATGASNLSNLGASGWQVQSSADATQTGAQISTPGFRAGGWLPVANDDAGAPGTEIEALAQNGRCPGDPGLQPVNQNPDGPGSIYYSDNLKSCYGFMSAVGADTVPAFDVPWWWRTDF